jgi:hypothetical protein
MPSLLCRCGYRHNLTPIPDDGFQVLPDWATAKLLYSMDTQPEDWEFQELHRTVVTRLYVCPNCEAVMWNRAHDGHYSTYLPSEQLIRIFADLDDRDPLDGIWLRHPRTLADIETQHLMTKSGNWIVVHNDHDEVYAQIELAVDDDGEPIADAWVARPLKPSDVARLRLP